MSCQPPTIKVKYYLGLNGIRAIAVAMVVWHHTGELINGIPFSQNGYLGVDLFFILSGFLITVLLIREKEESGTVSLRNFYARRSLRIFPLYYAVLFAAGALSFLAGSPAGQAAYTHDLPYLITYTGNWIGLKSILKICWSLCIEEQFYLVWPLLVALFGATWRLVFLIAFILLNQTINFGIFDVYLGSKVDLLAVKVTFTPIMLGAVLAEILWYDRAKRWIYSCVVGKRLLFWLVLVGVFLSFPGEMRGWPRLTLHVVFTFFLAGLILQPDHILVRLLSLRPLAFVGTVSYGVYLLHLFVLSFVERIPLDLRFKFPMTLLITVLIASLSFRFFESPLIKMKSLLKDRRHLRKC